MFTSNSLDKSCIGPDCTSGRNSASNRFPIGITSLGDENQQIRIQLAVHKYNSSANSPLNSRCAVTSPFRHSFLNNPVKSKNYEGEAEGTSKSERKNGNQYEGVGAFPTIHLKKRAVRYRPIRRYHDVKVSYPEIPANRFLNNLPETCPDLKTSTRSVLDVLEDLSGKKIHSKDDHGNSSKAKSKGLGGDYLLNSTALYKPLFVHKPKVNSVITRDNTTQTFPAVSTDTPSPQNSCIRNDDSDPKAELRRKLAKQNNEIFASLSSSISLSPIGLKRKIGKVLQSGDENVTEASASKNPKIDNQTNNINGNGISKTTTNNRTNSNDSIKINRRSKLHEPNSPATSPNKDRLTTIFLDMQNTSPKMQMFQKSTKSTSENESQPRNNFSNGFANAASTQNQSSFSNGGAESEVAEKGKSESNGKNGDLGANTGSTESKKPEMGEPNKAESNFSSPQVNSTTNEATKSISPTFQFGINRTGFNSSTTGQSESKCSDASKNVGDEGKKDSENQFTSKPFTFGSSTSKPNFSSFQFGVNGSTSLSSAASKDPPKELNSEGTTPSSITTSVPSPQFSFGTTSMATTSSSQSFVPQFTSTSPPKTLFAFGQNNSQSSETGKTPEKSAVSNNLSTSTIGASSDVKPGGFNFGQKSGVESPVKTSVGGSEVNTSGAPETTFSAGAVSFGTNPLQPGKTLYTFGDQTSGIPKSTGQESKFSFSFGQKAGSDQNKTEEESKNKNLFSFGQKSVGQESQNSSVSTNVTSQSQSLTTETSSVLGQNASTQVTTVPQMKFGQMSTPQIPSSLGDKSEASSLINTSTPTVSQCTSTFPIKTSVFGSSDFGNTTTQTSVGFKPTPASGSGLTFGSSVTTSSFGVSSTSKTAPTFGTSTAQSISGFGAPPTSQSPSAFRTSGPTPTFGLPATTQSTPTFTTSSTAQSGTNFSGTSTAQSVPRFGSSLVSQSTPSFGIPSSGQSTSTFGTSALQSTSGFGGSTTQSTSAFGTSTSQSTSAFGTPTSQSNSAFGTSTTQSTSALGTATTQSTLGFGTSTSVPNPVFGTPTTTQSTVRFDSRGPQTNTSFGTSTFSSPSSTQQNTTFGTSNSGFGASQSFSQPFESKPTSALGQSSGIFGQNQSQGFSSGTPFNSTQNNIFEQKSNTEGGIFDQNKIQTQGFSTTSPAFSSPNKYSFGMTSSGVTAFTSSPPNTTSAPVFNFGSNTTPNTFTFGSGSSAPNNTQFAFKGPSNEFFKFGAGTTAKEGPGFGGSAPSFSFGGQMNNNPVTEQKPSFNFGSGQASTSAPFSFGSTPSPSVFNFGGSSSGSSGSGFSFGTPTPGGPFGQSSTASPGAPFTVPGTFSIGSGSSQSRPRATARPRRRP